MPSHAKTGALKKVGVIFREIKLRTEIRTHCIKTSGIRGSLDHQGDNTADKQTVPGRCYQAAQHDSKQRNTTTIDNTAVIKDYYRGGHML